jgi:uncharacterized protein (TIGR03382 family)
MPAEESSIDQAATVCGKGPTVKGIDVSYYQGTIDWAKVRAAGVEYAFVRASDGLAYQDSKFAANWSGSRAAGVLHGAYQFFRPGQDPIVQADMLLAKIGTPAPDDLPPVIDVEAADGKTAAQITAGVKAWIAHVKAAIGKDPIIYTGFYFWRDSVGAPDLTSSPLWHAQYSTATCPNIAPPWQDWAFWQYTSSGSVNGISGNVDTNRFNGTRADLMALLGPVAPCAPLPADGGVIDDGDACFEGGGPAASMREVKTAGQGGDLVWTHTTEDAAEANYAQWNLDLTEAGTYKVEVYTAGAFAQSKQAKYTVQAAGAKTTVTIDQSAVDGWQSLGEIAFAAGGDQFVHLGDNTGELLADQVQLVFDAVRITRVTSVHADPETPDEPTDGGGCSSGGAGAGWAFGLVLVGLVRRRRR